MALIALFQNRRVRPLRPSILIVGGITLAAALVLSYSRASLLNVATALAVLLWLNRRRVPITRLLTIAGILGAAAAVLVIGFLPQFSRAYWLRISTSVQFLFDSPDAILSGRVRSWALLQEFLVQHPWHALLGVGYKTLPYSDFIGKTAIADNTYLSMLVETGIGGLLALCAMHWVIVRASYRAALVSDPRRSFLGTWMLCFWSGQIVQMLSGDLLTYWRVLPAYFCVLALATREER
jgi:putative inorganic carbon (hco3(-)) transporter